MDIKSISRRNFIRMSAAGAGSLCLASCYTGNGSQYRVLTNEEARIVDSLADQIIPPDEYAGGSEAGVTRFIDRQLAGFYSEHTRMYRVCLKGFEETCIKVYGEGFTGLSLEKQFEYLSNIESGKYNDPEWEGFTLSSFFGTLRNHCLQGYYGSPRHGGNKNHVSYRMMKLDYPLIIGRNHH